MSKQITTREERGQAIAQSSGQVKRIDECLYVVKSQSNNGEYTVNKVNGELLCDCPDNTRQARGNRLEYLPKKIVLHTLSVHRYKREKG